MKNFEMGEERSAAFYMERLYSQAEADKAKAGAQKVLNVIVELSKKLKRGDKDAED